MKTFLMTALLMIGSQAFANVELGKYRAVDANGGSVRANLHLKAGNAATMDVVTSFGTVNCSGRYTVRSPRLTAAVTCNSRLIRQTNVSIDITNVNARSIRSARGAEVDIVIDALGTNSRRFLLKKAD